MYRNTLLWCKLRQQCFTDCLSWGPVQSSAHSSRSQSRPEGHGAVSWHQGCSRDDQLLHRWESGIHLKQRNGVYMKIRNRQTVRLCLNVANLASGSMLQNWNRCTDVKHTPGVAKKLTNAFLISREMEGFISFNFIYWISISTMTLV